MEAHRLCRAAECLLVVLALGAAACDQAGPISSGPVPGPEIGGAASTVDRSQILVPAASNQEGGVFWPFVNLWSGNLVVVIPVLDIQAVGPDWELSFYYNSLLAAETTSLGRGWRHSHEIALEVPDPPQWITVRWGDGRRDLFGFDGNGWIAEPALHGMRIDGIAGGYELRDKHGFVYAFDLLGRLVAERDRNENTVAFGYDQDGRLSAITDASGRVCALSYAGGRLVSVSLAGSPPTTVQYAGTDLVGVADALGNATSFGYNQASLLASVADPDGAVITVGYHATLPVVLAVTTADGAERRFAYDQAALETTVTDLVAQGQESAIAYRFDTRACCTQVASATLGTTHNVYDGADDLVAHTDADGHTTTMAYGDAGDLASVTDAIGATVSFTYDPTHHLWTSATDQAGGTWTAQRDGNGNLTVEVDPLGNQEAWSYDARGLLTGYTDQRGNATSYGYDPNGYVSSMTDPLGNTCTAAYSDRGMPLSLTDEEGFTTVLAWNSRDEPVAVTLPGGEGYTLSWRADRMLASAQGPRGETVAFGYNGRKQVVSDTDPFGFVSTRAYDRAGYLTRLADAMGSAMDIDRDLAGRVVALRNADGGVVSFARSSCDILSRTDERGTLAYQYSPRHERTAVLGAGLQIDYARDARGYLISAVRQDLPNPPIGLQIDRDAAGRKTAVTRTDLGRTTTFVLDGAGNATLVQSPPSTPVSYVYDALNRVNTITAGSPPLTATLSYTPRRRLAAAAYSNGVAGTRDYDPDNRLAGIRYSGPGWICDYAVAHDPSGNRTFTGAVLPPPIGPMNLHVDWDVRNMPAMTNVVPGPGPTTISYDPARDRMQLVGPNGPIPYAYSAAHRMLSAGLRTFAWDLPGGCTQTTAPGSSMVLSYAADGALKQIVQNGQSFKLQVDALGRLAREVLPSGAQRLVAADDADGGLARVEYFATAGSQPIDSYVSAPGSLSAAGAGRPVRASDFVVVTGLVSSEIVAGQRIRVIRGRESQTPSDVMQFKQPPSPSNQWVTLPDPSGSITVRADGLGNVTQTRVFGAFGEKLAQSSLQHVATGFAGMEAVEGLGDLSLAGFAAGDAGGEHDPFAMGVAALRPYLPETGSFLYDAGFGPDGLYASFFGSPDGSFCGNPWCTGCKQHRGIPPIVFTIISLRVVKLAFQELWRRVLEDPGPIGDPDPIPAISAEDLAFFASQIGATCQ